jgi:hypothetical protein
METRARTKKVVEPADDVSAEVVVAIVEGVGEVECCLRNVDVDGWRRFRIGRASGA